MRTGTINYRVADFLKQYPPFQFMTESDQLALVAGGRVRFHESGEFLLWQGAPYRDYIFVIQQGSVALLETKGGEEILRDIVGAGDTLGLDRLSGIESSRYSAKSQSEVVVYALPFVELERLIAKYPDACQYVATQLAGSSKYVAPEQRTGAQQSRLLDSNAGNRLVTCHPEETIRQVANRILQFDLEAISVVDVDSHLLGVVSAGALLGSLASGKCRLDSPLSALEYKPSAILSPTATVSDAVLKMAETQDICVAITDDGYVGSRLQRLISDTDLVESFGDQPTRILREIKRAQHVDVLSNLLNRMQKFVLGELRSPMAVEWLSRLSLLIHSKILARVVEWNPPPARDFCWCYYGAAGREELLAGILPWSVVILENPEKRAEFIGWYGRIQATLTDIGYLRMAPPFDDSYSCAGLEEWTERFRGWVRNPVLTEMYQARPLFDLNPVLGSPTTTEPNYLLTEGARHKLWSALESAIVEMIRSDPNFLRVLAHDSLANVPPLTFFNDMVIDESGRETNVFQLKQTALLPLIDVGRVFGFVAENALSCSTAQRFAMAGKRLVANAAMFQEATETLSWILTLQTRIAIRQHSFGFELPPALLSRYDRQLLKKGFRSIGSLLEFAKNYSWPDMA